MEELEYYKLLLLEEANYVVIIITSDIDNPIVVYVNKAFAKLTGY